MMFLEYVEETLCEHEYKILGSGGGPEDGPETYYECTKCGKLKTVFGM